jgi:hypothetical protein
VAGVQEVLVKALTAHQLQRRFVLQVHIVEWFSDDLGHQHQTGLHIFDEAQVDGATQQAAHTQSQP